MTGETGEWFRIEAPDGGEAFVHGSLLTEASRSAETASALNLQPVCAGSAKGSACWKEVADKPGCYFWSPGGPPSPELEVTWSGQCAAGVVIREGTLSASRGSETNVLTGTFVQGKRHGHWVLRFADGHVEEGPYVDSKRHGHWVARWPDGTCANVEYSRGEIVSRSEC